MPQEEKKPPIGPVGAIGVFLAVFGIWLVVATFFTPTTYGRITNLVGAVLIGSTGLIAIVFDRRAAKRKATGEEQSQASQSGPNDVHRGDRGT